MALSRHLTLKNAVELLEFSCLYGAEQLQAACNQFICLNLAAVMENRRVFPILAPLLSLGDRSGCRNLT